MKSLNLRFQKMVLQRLFRDETAQATTEYILLLTIAMSFALLVLNTFIKPAYKKLEAQVTEKLDRAFGGKPHCFPILNKC